MSSVETEGWTIEEAIAAALTQLHAQREQVEIEVLSQATKGFLGIGGKKARVRATVRKPLSTQIAEESAPKRPSRQEPGPGRPLQEREDVRRVEPPRHREAAPPRPRREEQRPRREDPRPRREETPRAESPAPEPPRMRDSGTPSRREESRREATALAPQTEVTLPSRELGEKACQVLQEVLRLMELDAAVTLAVHEEEMVVTIAHAAEGVLIGRNGQTLDALEYVVNRIITRSEENEGHVALDAEGYRERRRKSLETLALRLGERAKRRRKTVALGPLSPRDRRIIHVTLEGDPLVTTRSMGRGYLRRLFIMPEERQRRERGRGGPPARASE